MGNVAAELFRKAASINREDPLRQGNVVHIPSGREVILTGDFHGNRMNFTRTLSFAGLDAHPQRILVLQEIIHGPLDERTGVDRSVELLMRAARLKVSKPGQIVFLLGNHDVAQVTGNEITKQAMGSCEQFDKGVKYNYPDDWQDVQAALNEFLLSLPLAARTPGGMFMAHSMPSPKRMHLGGVEVFDRPWQEEDLRRGGPVYEWTWGRGQTPEQTAETAEKLGVEFFLLGHRHVSAGWELVTDRALTLASDHGQGCLMRFGSDETLTAETVEAHTNRILSV